MSICYYQASSMKRSYTILGVLILLLLIGALGIHAYRATHQRQAAVTATISYLCRDGKSITASYTATNAALTLSDTRTLVLPHVSSGSGTRYQSGTTVFVAKGDNAYLEENGTQTYADCVVNGSPATASNGLKQFADSAGTFTFMYPSSIAVTGGGMGYTQDWMVNATTSGLLLAKASLDASFQPHTNFVEATLRVGTSADPSAVSQCLTYNPSGGPGAQPVTRQTINGTAYTVMRASDAAAGNRYDTTSYRTIRNNQCYVIEYTIHYGNIQNYDPAMGVKEFNEAAVAKVMDGIVQSFRFTDGAQ